MIRSHEQATRIEHDSLGEKEIPAHVYYGIQTARAIENFPISGVRAYPAFVEATVQIKKAAVMVHRDLKLLPLDKANAILQAADEVLGGKLRDQFIVDVFQAGAGTSHNMNCNEVLANRAIEILGGQKGNYQLVHPNDHVNMGQSTNDVIPTAIRLASLALVKQLLPVLEACEDALTKKSREFDAVIKAGRTHLQDALPIRLGQEFGGYAACVTSHRHKIERTTRSLKHVGMGGTAVGTGLNTHPEYRQRMIKLLSEQTGFTLEPTENYFEAMQSIAPFTELSAALRNMALDLVRIANDLRLLSSGPRTGLSELTLPAVQPGSSIMPGKVNPVMAEMLDMACFYVVGLDTTVAMASQAGQLELNVMMPVVAYALCQSLVVLTHAIDVFTQKCVVGIQANPDRCQEYAENTVSIATVLNMSIGYEKAAEVVKEAVKSGKSVQGVLVQRKILTPEKVSELFSNLSKFTEPGIPST